MISKSRLKYTFEVLTTIRILIEKKNAKMLAQNIAKSTIKEHILCPYRRSNAVIWDGFHNFFLPLTREMKRMRLICTSSIKLCLRLHLTASLREVLHLWGQVLAMLVVWIWIEYILFLRIWSVDSAVESRAKMLMGPRPKVDLKNTHISYALRSVFDLWILHCGCHHNIWQSYDPN